MTNIETKHSEIKEYLWDTWKNSDRYRDFIVELNNDEIEEAKKVAKSRNDAARDAKSKNPRLSNSPSFGYERDILGALGEMAAIKWFRDNGYNPSIEAFIDTEVRGKDDTFDTDFVFDGEKISVEIKTTTKPVKAKLIYPLHKGRRRTQPDVFVLVSQIDESRYCIKGFADKDTMLKNVDDTLPKKAYAIRENKLKKDLQNTLKTNIINNK